MPELISLLRWLMPLLPTGILACLHGWSMSHPWIAIPLAVIGSIIVWLAVRFVKPVLEHVSDSFERAGLRRATPFEKDYRAYLRNRLRAVDTKGLITVGSSALDLEDVYIDVSLVPTPPNQIPTGVLSDQHSGLKRRKLDDFLSRPEPARLAVLGGPGSGKTTLLKHTAYSLAPKKKHREEVHRPVPILLQLREVQHIFDQEPVPSLASIIGSDLRDRLNTQPSGGWWELQLKKGRCTVLLDGLDEIALLQDRHDVSKWIDQQIARYGKNDFVVTSRPGGYAKAKLAGASILAVQPFTPDQAERFIKRWHRAVLKEEDPHSGDGHITDADEAAAELHDKLMRSPALIVFTENPLLLTMLLNVHRFRRRLPDSRTELYTEICQALLDERQSQKRLPILLNGSKKISILSELAFSMMSVGTRAMEDAAVGSVVSPALVRAESLVSFEDFMADVSSNGLLQERELGTQAFVHLSFQEYLAARYLHEQHLHAAVEEVLEKSWWWETIVFFAALTGPDHIVRACLDRATPETIALAQRCAEQGDLTPELQVRLDEATALDEEATAKQITRAAAALLRQYAHQVTPIDEHSAMCHDLLSWNLFRLFVRSQRRAENETAFRVDPSTGALLGLWRSDVVAVIDWMNSLQATTSGESFRLPSEADLETTAGQWAVRRHRSELTARSGTNAFSVADPFSVWVTGGPIQLWPAPRTGLTLSREQLAEALALDAGFVQAIAHEIAAHMQQTVASFSSIPYGAMDRDERLAAGLNELVIGLDRLSKMDLGLWFMKSFIACVDKSQRVLTELQASTRQSRAYSRLSVEVGSGHNALLEAKERANKARRHLQTPGMSIKESSLARLDFERAELALSRIEREYDRTRQQQDNLSQRRAKAHLHAREIARDAQQLLQQAGDQLWERISPDLRRVYGLSDIHKEHDSGLLRSVARTVSDRAAEPMNSEGGLGRMLVSAVLRVLKVPDEFNIDLSELDAGSDIWTGSPAGRPEQAAFRRQIDLVFGQKANLPADKLSMLRHEALVMAFNSGERPSLARKYLDLAAGITLTDLRVRNPRQVSEAVLLVVEHDHTRTVDRTDFR